MQYTQALTILAAIVGLTSAAPANEARQFKAVLTFTGAAASYTREVPADGSVFYTNDDLSIDSVTLAGGATCTLFGGDGAEVTVVGANTVPVGPPQPIVSGSCLAL